MPETLDFNTIARAEYARRWALEFDRNAEHFDRDNDG
jgi:hypothetical protein